MSNILKVVDIMDSSKVKFNEPMSKYTTIKIGGPADAIVFPSNVEDIINTLKFAKKNDIPVTVIGNGSKLLVRDKGIRGIVIKVTGSFNKFKVYEDNTITVGAGMSMPRISRLTMKEGMSGFEFACGIPGVIGGGVRMNAGAYGSEISDILVRTTYIDDEFELKTLEHAEHNFGYRYSLFKDHPEYIIVSAEFKLEKKSKEEIKAKIDQNTAARKEKQPLEYPNAGSTFKRPEGYFVGTMIEDLGLKGYRIGDAEVSTKHAGFIVNRGKATAADVISLIEYLKERVYEKYSVKLENEIEIIGEE